VSGCYSLVLLLSAPGRSVYSSMQMS